MATNDLCKRLRDARTAAKLTQEEVAERLSIDRSVYSRIEAGEVALPVERLVRLARILKTDASELLRTA